jgi:hypothetical protein
MNQDMLLYQARQDFIDMHKDLLKGASITLQKYEEIASDLKKMDDINLEALLSFVEETENIQINMMWTAISKQILEIKRSKKWSEQRLYRLSWQHNKIIIRP